MAASAPDGAAPDVVAHPAQPPRFGDSADTVRTSAYASPDGARGGGGGGAGDGATAALSLWLAAHAGHDARTRSIASRTFARACSHRSPGSIAHKRSAARRIDANARQDAAQSVLLVSATC